MWEQPLTADAATSAIHKIRDFSRMIAPSADALKFERDGIIVGEPATE